MDRFLGMRLNLITSQATSAMVAEMGKNIMSDNSVLISAHRLLPNSAVIVGELPMLTEETVKAYLWARNGKPRKDAMVYTIDDTKYLVTNHPTHSGDFVPEYEENTEQTYTVRTVTQQSIYDYDGAI